MKELSIEEKAKRYDEAIEALGSLFAEQAIKHCDRVNIKDITNIFPELKESEDEKIRKNIIATIHLYYGEPLDDEAKEMIAWLEKQGEQKCTAEEVLIKAGLKPYKDGDQWCILLGDNIQEGICGFGDTINDALYAFLNDLIKSQKEQKPAWSEEDEELLNTIINHFKVNVECTDDDDIIKWLKSLKDRVQPQSTWKPSDKQITWLYRATDEARKDSRMKHVLNELLSDLRKLREE